MLQVLTRSTATTTKPCFLKVCHQTQTMLNLPKFGSTGHRSWIWNNNHHHHHHLLPETLPPCTTSDSDTLWKLATGDHTQKGTAIKLMCSHSKRLFDHKGWLSRWCGICKESWDCECWDVESGGMGFGPPPLFIYFHSLGIWVAWNCRWLCAMLGPLVQECCKSGKYRFTLIAPPPPLSLSLPNWL